MKKRCIIHISIYCIVWIGINTLMHASSVDSARRYDYHVDSLRADQTQKHWLFSIGGGFFKVPNRFESQGEFYLSVGYETKDLSIGYVQVGKPDLDKMDAATYGWMVGRTWVSGIASYSLMAGPGYIDNIYKSDDADHRSSGFGLVTEFKHSISYKQIGLGASICVNINPLTSVVYFSTYIEFAP